MPLPHPIFRRVAVKFNASVMPTCSDFDGGADFRIDEVVGKMILVVARTVDDKWISDSDWRNQTALCTDYDYFAERFIEIETLDLAKASGDEARIRRESASKAASEKRLALKWHACPVDNDDVIGFIKYHTVRHRLFKFLATGVPVKIIHCDFEDLERMHISIHKTADEKIAEADKKPKSKAEIAEMAVLKKAREDQEKKDKAAHEAHIAAAARARVIKEKQAPPPPPMPAVKPITAAKERHLAAAKSPTDDMSPEKAFADLAAVRTNSGELRKAAAGAKRARSDDKPAGGAGGSKPKRK